MKKIKNPSCLETAAFEVIQGLTGPEMFAVSRAPEFRLKSKACLFNLKGHKEPELDPKRKRKKEGPETRAKFK